MLIDQQQKKEADDFCLRERRKMTTGGVWTIHFKSLGCDRGGVWIADEFEVKVPSMAKVEDLMKAAKNASPGWDQLPERYHLFHPQKLDHIHQTERQKSLPVNGIARMVKPRPRLSPKQDYAMGLH